MLKSTENNEYKKIAKECGFIHYSEVKQGIKKFPISDVNTTYFNEQGFENCFEWVDETSSDEFPTVAVAYPTGVLQLSSISLDRRALSDGAVLEGKALEDEEKILWDKAEKTELATTGKVLRAAEKFKSKGYKVVRFKPDQKRNTPVTTTVASGQLTSEYKMESNFKKLEETLNKLGIPFTKVGGVVELTKELLSSTNKEVNVLINAIQTAKTNFLCQTSHKLPFTLLQQEDFNFSKFTMNPFGSQKDKATKGWFILLPWSAMITKKGRMCEYNIQVEKFNALLKGKEQSDLFEALVDNAATIRLTHIYNKIKPKMSYQEWSASRLPSAKKGAEDYLRAELPWFLLEIQTAIELYQATKLPTYFCYPMQSPLGTPVFEFLVKICRLGKINYQEAFFLTDITELLLKKPQVKLVASPSALFPLPQSARQMMVETEQKRAPLPEMITSFFSENALDLKPLLSLNPSKLQKVIAVIEKYNPCSLDVLAIVAKRNPAYLKELLKEEGQVIYQLIVHDNHNQFIEFLLDNNLFMPLGFVQKGMIAILAKDSGMNFLKGEMIGLDGSNKQRRLNELAKLSKNDLYNLMERKLSDQLEFEDDTVSIEDAFQNFKQKYSSSDEPSNLTQPLLFAGMHAFFNQAAGVISAKFHEVMKHSSIIPFRKKATGE